MKLERREFLQVATLASGALLVGVFVPGCGTARGRGDTPVVDADGAFAPNVWITITPDDRVLVAAEKSEMGQGILTSHAMLVAEELEVPLSRVQASSADAAPEYRTSFGMQMTGGSTSLRESYLPLRKAAAAAREMLVAAAAARWGVDPAQCVASEGLVRHEPSGRSARYGELGREAAQREVPAEPRLKEPSEFRILGKPAVRVDAAAKVDGSAVFGADVRLPGILVAHVIRPPVFGATAVSVAADEARREPGVVDVVEYHRGVAVLADRYWQARRAASKVRVEWSDAPIDGVDSERVAQLARDASRHPGKAVQTDGRVDDVWDRKGLRLVDAVYEAPYLAHATLEPLVCTARIADGKAELWAPTQSPTIAQNVAATICGLREENVEVHVTLLGGGFGRKVAPDFIVDAVVLAQRVGRPVQVQWSREDDMRGGYYRPFAVARMRGAVDAEGQIQAWRDHTVSQPLTTDVLNLFAASFPGGIPDHKVRKFVRSAVSFFRTGVVPEFLAMEGANELPYAIPNQSVEFTPIQTTIPVCFWRSVGHSYNGFVVEGFVDELAHAARIDPLEFRRRHMTDERLLAVMNRAAEEAGWGTPLEPGFGRGIAAHKSFDTYVAEVAEAGVVEDRIVVRKVTCAVDCGIVVNPDVVKMNMEGGIIFGLSAALKQKITLRDGRIEQGNYDDYPMLRMHETPAIDVHIVESTESPTGVGEPGLPPIAPAVANAIFAATGVRLRSMPFEDAWRNR